MAGFNKVILIGNLTRDPELRYSTKGTAIAKLGLAVNRNWRTETGETREEVTFVDVDSFGRQAETLSQYLKKGSPLMVEGRLRYEQWDDKQTGQKRSRLGVVLEGFQFLGRGEGGGGGGAGGGGEGTPAPRRSAPAGPAAAAASGAPEFDGPDEDDVPF